jgi:thiamine-monophosphate kinase
MRLRDLGEANLIDRIRNRFQNTALPVGIGDDAAIVDMPPGHSLVYCSDLLSENTHFIRGIHPPDSVGYKVVAVNVSDVGAMGGIPMYFVISLAAPGDLELEWIDHFYSGVERACGEFGIALVGGDTSSAGSIFVDVSMVGRIRTGGAVLRSGARAGDKIYVTGTLGGSALGLDLLRAGKTDAPAVQRHLYPEPRHRVGLAVAKQAHAMTDVSDGLSTDLMHIVVNSGVSARIYKEKLPAAPGASNAQVLHGGEEYELIITTPELPPLVEGVAITCIGEITASKKEHQVLLVDGSTESVLHSQGWDHYVAG